MPFRFVHAADIHLDSPLRSLALRDPDLAELIGNATRRALVRIVDLCLDEQVDALLLAGDLYDGDQTSMKTARFLAEQIRRLHEASIRVFIIRGNHDAIARITQELTFPDSVKVFGGRAEAIEIDRADGAMPVVVHGLSFAERYAPESLLPKYRPAVEGAVNIGMMHTSLAGAPGHDLYAPCSLADLQRNGFRYWALGHVHKRSVVEGDCAVVMPGMPQGRDIGESGARSVCLVTVADDGSVRIEERFTSIAQFERACVEVTNVDDWPALAAALGGALERMRGEAACEHVVARLQVTGSTPLAWRIMRDRDLLKAEADDRAAAIGSCWVEKLEIDCRAPAPQGALDGDPLMELRRIIADDVVPSGTYQGEVTDIAKDLMAQLPPECRDLLGADEDAFRDRLAALVLEGAEDVLARLHARQGSGEP